MATKKNEVDSMMKDLISSINKEFGTRIAYNLSEMDAPTVVIGSGVRRSKIVLPGSLLSVAPGVHIVDGLAHPITS